MSEKKRVTVDIGKYPGGYDVHKRNKSSYYYNNTYGNNEKVTMTLDESPSECPGYRKVVHTPDASNAMIEGIEDNAEPLRDFNYITYDCQSVTTYYWSGDKSYNKLVVQLDYKTKSVHYITHDGETWVNAGMNEDGGTNEDIVKCLDEQNCKWNGVHIMDISEASGDGYKCSACRVQILITSVIKNEYKIITHRPRNGYVGKIRHGQKTLVGLEIEEDVPSVDVYWYPIDARPVLMHIVAITPDGDKEEPIRTSKWYRQPKSGNTWNELLGPPSDSDTDKILKVLRKMNDDLNSDGHSGMAKISSTSPSSLSGAVIAGIVVGGVAGMCLIGLAVWKCGHSMRNFLARRQTGSWRTHRG